MPKKQPNSAETHSKHAKYNAKNPPCKTYGFLIYPESADPNFRQIISENFDGSWALSPLHDSDMSGLFIGQTASLNAIRVVRKFDLDQVVNAIFDSILSFVIQFFYEFS